MTQARPQRGPRIIEQGPTTTFSFKKGTSPEPVTARGPEKTYAETNPEFVSISLPSKFQPYEFKSLSCRTLLALHQAKFNRAHSEGRIRFTVEAISATLEPGLSAFDLTPGDFYFLMYWQKVNSFPKTPLLIENHCIDKDHHLKVAKGEMDKATLRTEEILQMTTLKTEYAEDFNLDTFKVGLENYALGYETMRDVVDLSEFVMDSKEDTTEFVWLAEYASFLKPQMVADDKGRQRLQTLHDRCEIVAKMTPDEITAMDRYMEAVTNYGVEESATIKCRGCGASTERKLQFDALSFLPVPR